MSIKRLVVDTGVKFSHFCAYDLQNKYYKYLFLSNARKYIGDKPYEVDTEFEKKSKNYWKRHTGININTLWHSFYSFTNGIKDVRYIPENLYYAYIEPFYNRKDFAQCCDDKCYYPERFPENAFSEGVNRPPIYLRNIGGMFFDESFNILSSNDAIEYISNNVDGYVIKESITGRGGNRILFVEKGTRKTKDEIRKVFEQYNKDFVVEGIIEQCQELGKLNPTSVNTIRFITYLDETGTHLLSSVLRIGGKNARMDNFSTGGMACGIHDDGSLKECGYDQYYNKFERIHPNGIQFAGAVVPSFEKAERLVERLHPRFGHFRVISWDVAIGLEYEPILIEFNLTPQGIDLHQINNGPLFGNYTDKILGEVFKKQLK